MNRKNEKPQRKRENTRQVSNKERQPITRNNTTTRIRGKKAMRETFSGVQQAAHIPTAPNAVEPLSYNINEDFDNDTPDPQNLILEGRKSVLEALNHQKPIDRILVRCDRGKQVEGTLRLIVAKARELKIVVQEVERTKLDETSETGHHQGIIALCPAVPYVEVADILQIAKDRNQPPFIIILDGVTDPHNLGAVMRTAECSGAHGVIIPKRRAVGLTGTVARTSAGAINHIAVARVNNISRTLEELKAAGVWIACANMEGTSLYETDLSGPIAIVLGAEGEGVSRLVAEKSDFAVKIPMLGLIQSLNVSVAAGVISYEVVRARLAGQQT